MAHPELSPDTEAVSYPRPERVLAWDEFPLLCADILNSPAVTRRREIGMPQGILDEGECISEFEVVIQLEMGLFTPLRLACEAAGFDLRARLPQNHFLQGMNGSPDMCMQDGSLSRLLYPIEVKTSKALCLEDGDLVRAYASAAESDRVRDIATQMFMYVEKVPYGVLITDQQLFCVLREDATLYVSPGIRVGASLCCGHTNHSNHASRTGFSRGRAPHSQRGGAGAQVLPAAAAPQRSLTPAAALYCMAELSRAWWDGPHAGSGGGRGGRGGGGSGGGGSRRRQGGTGSSTDGDGGATGGGGRAAGARDDTRPGAVVQPQQPQQQLQERRSVVSAAAAGTASGLSPALPESFPATASAAAAAVARDDTGVEHVSQPRVEGPASSEGVPGYTGTTDGPAEVTERSYASRDVFGEPDPRSNPLRCLGHGASGVVLEGRIHGRPAAVKVADLSKRPEAREMFRREAAVYTHLQALQGVCVPHLLAYGYLDGGSYFLATGLEGPSLSREDAWPEEQAAVDAVIRSAVNTLYQVHAAGVVHGDVALRNLVFSRRRSSGSGRCSETTAATSGSGSSSSETTAATSGSGSGSSSSETTAETGGSGSSSGSSIDTTAATGGRGGDGSGGAAAAPAASGAASPPACGPATVLLVDFGLSRVVGTTEAANHSPSTHGAASLPDVLRREEAAELMAVERELLLEELGVPPDEAVAAGGDVDVDVGADGNSDGAAADASVACCDAGGGSPVGLSAGVSGVRFTQGRVRTGRQAPRSGCVRARAVPVNCTAAAGALTGCSRLTRGAAERSPAQPLLWRRQLHARPAARVFAAAGGPRGIVRSGIGRRGAAGAVHVVAIRL